MTQVALAALAIAGTLGGVMLGGRLEHRRWLRDKRLQAYVSYNAALAAWQLLQTTDADQEALDDSIRELVTRRGEMLLLAKRDVGLHAVETTHAALESYGRGSEGDHEGSEEAMARAREHSLRLLAMQMLDVQGPADRRRRSLRLTLEHLRGSHR